MAPILRGRAAQPTGCQQGPGPKPAAGEMRHRWLQGVTGALASHSALRPQPKDGVPSPAQWPSPSLWWMVSNRGAAKLPGKEGPGPSASKSNLKKKKKKGIAVFLALKPESTMVDHTSHPSSPGAVSVGSPLQPGPCFTRFSAPHLLQHQQQCPRLLMTLFGTLGAALAAGLGAEAHGDSSILPARGSACAKSQHVGGAGVGQLSRARVPARWGWAFRKTLGHEICDGRDCAVHWHWDFSMCERQVMELCRFSSHQPWDRDLLGGTFLLPLYRF